MKKAIILLCVMWIFQLTACSTAPESGESAQIPSGEAAGTEAYELKVPPEDRNQCFWWSLGFVETSDCYYYKRNHLIYFCPRGGDTFRPLCSKPNCEHKDKNCNAWIGFAFGYYDGALYTADVTQDFEVELIKMNLDGTDHHIAAKEKLDVPRNSSFYLFFHHGKLFIDLSTADDLYSSGQPLEQREDHLIVLDLSDYSQAEPFADYAPISRFVCVKDKIYGMESRYELEVEESKLLEMDTATGEVRTLNPAMLDPYTDIYIADDTLCYFELNNKLYNALNGTDYEEGNPGFREIDLKTGVIKDCGLPIEDIFSADYDADYIYAVSPRPVDGGDYKLYILSRDYELLDQITLKSNQIPYVSASDRVFFSDIDDFGSCITFYLDKSQIGSGNLQLIPIETVG